MRTLTNKLTVLSAALAAIAIMACEETENQEKKLDKIDETTDGVTVVDGTLHFATIDDYYSYTSKVGSMSDDERIEYERTLGFESMLTLFNEAADRLSEIDDDNEFIAEASKYSNLLKVSNDLDIIPNISSASYSAICNAEGFYYIGDVINMVTPTHLVYFEEGAPEDIAKVINGEEIKSDKAWGMDSYVVSQTYLKSTACGASATAWVETSDRKCDLIVKVYADQKHDCCFKNCYRYKYEYQLTNYKGKRRWKRYDTTNEIRNFDFKLKVPDVIGTDGVNSIYKMVDYTFKLEYKYFSTERSRVTQWDYIGDPVTLRQDLNMPAASFDYIHCEASNRGVGNRWAIINCGSK